MRLIDADDATRVVEGVLKKYGLDRESVVTDEIHDAIDNIQTAYDVEKVVEQIEFSKDCRALLGNMPRGQLSASDSAFNEAIDIIRKGGVNERD